MAPWPPELWNELAGALMAQDLATFSVAPALLHLGPQEEEMSASREQSPPESQLGSCLHLPPPRTTQGNKPKSPGPCLCWARHYPAKQKMCSGNVGMVKP